jgi:Flp pilus assembly protein TadG
MNDSRDIVVKLPPRRVGLDERGVAAVELALILPLILMMLFAIIDFGRYIQARLVLTNLAREGGSIASRDIPEDLITMLQEGAKPLEIATSGKIYVWKIKAGTSKAPSPAVDVQNSKNAGALSVPSSVGSGQNLGLSTNLYNHLVFDSSKNTSDISEVTLVEVFYKYTPITPLSNFLPLSGEMIISSKAGF